MAVESCIHIGDPQIDVASDPVLEELQKRLESARSLCVGASRRFDEVNQSFRARVRHPDGVEEIRIASEEYAEALHALREAVRNHTSYLHDRILPDSCRATSVPIKKPVQSKVVRVAGVDGKAKG